MVSTPLLIGGVERAAAVTFPVYDPAHTGEVIGHAAAASAADAADAVRAAHEAWPSRPRGGELSAVWRALARFGEHQQAGGRLHTRVAQPPDYGRLTLPIWRSYPLAQAVRAHKDLEAGRNRGKIVLRAS
ncbi:MAG TPA: zinc-binding dehydrogenase [Trebonia sp.]|nr:zinc-binding dehydrogenase [Trebonia sp.]